MIQDVIVTDFVFREELHINLQLQLSLIQTQVQKSDLTGVWTQDIECTPCALPTELPDPGFSKVGSTINRLD